MGQEKVFVPQSVANAYVDAFGPLPDYIVVMKQIPKMRRPGMRPRPAARPKTVFQPRSKSA